MVTLCFCLLNAGLLLGLFFDSEDEAVCFYRTSTLNGHVAVSQKKTSAKADIQYLCFKPLILSHVLKKIPFMGGGGGGSCIKEE
jgi:hypothetical protein